MSAVFRLAQDGRFESICPIRVTSKEIDVPIQRIGVGQQFEKVDQTRDLPRGYIMNSWSAQKLFPQPLRLVTRNSLFSSKMRDGTVDVACNHITPRAIWVSTHALCLNKDLKGDVSCSG